LWPRQFGADLIRKGDLPCGFARWLLLVPLGVVDSALLTENIKPAASGWKVWKIEA
jgi:hypothetical protein